MPDNRANTPPSEKSSKRAPDLLRARTRTRELDEDTPSPRLKARIYTALIDAQQQTGPLKPLADSERSGYGLCRYEKLISIAPLPRRATEAFVCRVCSPRLLAEHLDKMPLRWTHCPYCDFQEG